MYSPSLYRPVHRTACSRKCCCSAARVNSVAALSCLTTNCMPAQPLQQSVSCSRTASQPLSPTGYQLPSVRGAHVGKVSGFPALQLASSSRGTKRKIICCRSSPQSFGEPACGRANVAIAASPAPSKSGVGRGSRLTSWDGPSLSTDVRALRLKYSLTALGIVFLGSRADCGQSASYSVNHLLARRGG